MRRISHGMILEYTYAVLELATYGTLDLELDIKI